MSETYDVYDFSKPSRAVIASLDSREVVLWYVGGHLAIQIDDEGTLDPFDLGLYSCPDGISIWEGAYDYHPGTRFRVGDPKGSFRAPTAEEWDAIHKAECPWDDNDWLLPQE